MKWLRTAVLFLFLLMMVGCQTIPPPPVVIRYVAVLPPDSLLIDCFVVPPPDRALYLRSELEQRERLLIDVGMSQNKELTKCRLNTKGLRNWKAEQKLLYKETKE